MNTPPKAPQILKVRGNPPPAIPLIPGHIHHVQQTPAIPGYTHRANGTWLVEDDILPYLRLDAPDDLVPYETRYLAGDWIIEGDIPIGAQIEVTGGNLEVRGDLGRNVQLKTFGGNITFRSADDGCKIAAEGGSVTFQDVGDGCVVEAESITGEEICDGVELRSHSGDIRFNRGGNGTILDSTGDITFHTLGTNARCTVPGTLTYHTMPDPYSVMAGAVVCTNPNTAVSLAHTYHVGKLNPQPICEGVWHDAPTQSYVIELQLSAPKEAKKDFVELMKALQQNEATIKRLSPRDGPRQFVISIAECTAESASHVQQAIDGYIEKQREREKPLKR